jgi:hypothetical protein
MYDTKVLLDMLKEKGLDVAEDAATVVVDVVFDWVSKSAVETESKIDDVIAGLLPAIKPYVMEQVDRIDGQVG